MRRWLLRHTPRWTTTVIWATGMLFGAAIVLSLLANSFTTFAKALNDESVGLALLSLVLLAGAVVVARWWWSEVRRWREILPTD